MNITYFKNSININDINKEKLTNIGYNIMNSVAIILLAGGQGSRLGLNKPKGMLKLNGISLFEKQAEQIKELYNKTNVNIPWYIMTSDKTHDDTLKYFNENNYFNLNKNNIIFFKQGNNY